MTEMSAPSPPTMLSVTSIPSSVKVFWSSIAPATRIPTLGKAPVPGVTPGCSVSSAAAQSGQFSHRVTCNLASDLGVGGLQFRLCCRLYLNLLAHGAEFQLEVHRIALRYVHMEGGARGSKALLGQLERVFTGRDVGENVLPRRVRHRRSNFICCGVHEFHLRIRYDGSARIRHAPEDNPRACSLRVSWR